MALSRTDAIIIDYVPLFIRTQCTLSRELLNIINIFSRLLILFVVICYAYEYEYVNAAYI